MNVIGVALETPAVQTLLRRLEPGGVLSLTSVAVSAQPFLVAMLRSRMPARPMVVVTSGLKLQEGFHQELTTWLGGRPDGEAAVARPLFYPAWETLPHEARLPHADVISERLETLVTLNDRDASPLVVASVSALMQKTFAPAELKARTRMLRRHDTCDPLDLIEWLEEVGYEPEAQVTEPGHIALRGGIVDVFPLTGRWPVRLEFFGNELESLRRFDPLTQISREEVEHVIIPPGGELGILKHQIAANRAPAPAGSAGDGKPAPEKRSLALRSDPPREAGEPAAHATMTGHAHESSPALDAPSPMLEGKVGRQAEGDNSSPGAPSPATGTQPVFGLATLLDYVPEDTLFLISDPELVDEQAALYAGQIPAGDPFFLSWAEFRARVEARRMTWVELREGDPSVSPPPAAVGEPPGIPFAALHAPRFQSLEAFRPIAERAPEPPVAEAQRREFFSQLHRWLRQGFALHVFCNNDGERQRFEEIWAEMGFARGDAYPTLHLGTLSRGFLFEEARLVVVTDAEIFGRYKVQRPRRLKSPHAQTSRSLLDLDFTELEEGDLVVHVQYGIGRYLGLGPMPRSSRVAATTPAAAAPSAEECLILEYAPSGGAEEPPRLYVPVAEAHLVSKYVGAGKARPPLNTLGGQRWQKAKEHVERAVRDLAGELLAIQAARESQPGLAFAADAPWQREFESAFLYEETPDQMKAILDTKADMEQPKPMDRLICGDVGYGKTEVAIRAAFKAVMGGKQVALLVPTTVLAQQHFNTFRERMSDYPVRIELLSRFRSRREQRKVIENLILGSTDIVIGTHRLLQADIQFKDLGLVVIDEEQRFGVLHKEKFKRLRTQVDVLTLSATPIPRTLYLALTGARDMSTIETPPQDRLPVETIACGYDERVIRDAIQRELNRQGQVFFLHNRVATIETVATRLRALVPQARLVVGHGQMDADDLEEVMTAFVNGDADVLLSTTIIESGLDIPNANTIIIDRADRFGLSDLYQLRGRVGRYKHQAYAYLLLPRHAGLLSDARKRISAIRQYSSLGSGFKIALRDLEIRGAGNLLGPEQSGHITAVGFELYCQLLQQSIAAAKGQKVRPRVDVQVRLDFLAMNPAEETDTERRKPPGRRRKADWEEIIEVPREGAVFVDEADEAEPALRRPPPAMVRAPAYLPFDYLREASRRIEIYRRLAQITDPKALQRLRGELRDRFGPLPAAVERLLLVTELKVLAAARHVTAIDVVEDKLMLTRHGDLLAPGGKFPRLKQREAEDRLKEIRKLLLTL